MSFKNLLIVGVFVLTGGDLVILMPLNFSMFVVPHIVYGITRVQPEE